LISFKTPLFSQALLKSPTKKIKALDRGSAQLSFCFARNHPLITSDNIEQVLPLEQLPVAILACKTSS
jgi:hypothetical protein